MIQCAEHPRSGMHIAPQTRPTQVRHLIQATVEMWHELLKVPNHLRMKTFINHRRVIVPSLKRKLSPVLKRTQTSPLLNVSHSAKPAATI